MDRLARLFYGTGATSFKISHFITQAPLGPEQLVVWLLWVKQTSQCRTGFFCLLLSHPHQPCLCFLPAVGWAPTTTCPVTTVAVHPWDRAPAAHTMSCGNCSSTTAYPKEESSRAHWDTIHFTSTKACCLIHIQNQPHKPIDTITSACHS